MKKPYLMNITESKTKQIIVWAENRSDAIKDTEDICNGMGVDMDSGSFKRDIFVQFKASGYDFDIFDSYGYDEDCLRGENDGT